MNLLEVDLEYSDGDVYAIGKNNAFKFKLPKNKTQFHNDKKQSPKMGILGIRPTDIILHTNEEAGWNAKFDILFSELLGHEANLILKYTEIEINSLIPAMNLPKELKSTEFYFKLHFAHLFDIKTGENLNP
jgi:ABC-type sugar transport system ATPase subunit